MGKQWQTLFWGAQILADGGCNHEIKTCLILGRKSIFPSKPRQHIESRNISLLIKFCIVKAMVFPVVMYGCDSWTIKKAECQRIDAFKLWCWRRFLKVPWKARRSNQSILKEINLEYSLEVLQEGGPLPGPETGLLSNTQKWIVRGVTCADKQEILSGKGTQVESSRVREPRRTALSHGLQSGVLWWWD